MSTKNLIMGSIPFVNVIINSDNNEEIHFVDVFLVATPASSPGKTQHNRILSSRACWPRAQIECQMSNSHQIATGDNFTDLIAETIIRPCARTTFVFGFNYILSDSKDELENETNPRKYNGWQRYRLFWTSISRRYSNNVKKIKTYLIKSIL